MIHFFMRVLDWSEVWALLIPLSVLYFRRKQPKFFQPVIIYIWFALFLNLGIDLIMVFKHYFPAWLQSNNPFYNVHSVVRFICLSIFFIQIPQSSFQKLKKSLPIVSVAFFLINFLFFENFFNFDHLSGNLLAAEAYLLLVYCMLYYLSSLREDSKMLFDVQDFWIVTGLSIYLVINFFVFLFYVPMLENHWLVNYIWNVHNIAYIIFCIFIAKAFYGPIRNKYTN